MDLDLDIGSLIGRKPTKLAAEVTRELAKDDLQLLTEERGVQPVAIKRLTARHHSLARSLAAGVTQGEAAIINGYTDSRVSILMKDPTFRELYEFYKRDKDAAYIGMHEQLAGLAQDAIEELRDRMEDDPADFSKSMLMDIIVRTADRTGHGPATTNNSNMTLNVNVAERLGAARKRVADAKIVDITPKGDDDGGSANKRTT